MKKVHASLFSGIGGFDLAAEWMGWENLFHCEIDPFCQKVLKYHFPNSIQHNDITKENFTKYRGLIDVLSGGFPCQPYSSAGLRKGTADIRHLWPEMLRAIREIKPTWIVGENVRGLISWNEGMVFDQIQTDLENEGGYEVLPFLLPACGVNAPHRRERVIFVAYDIRDRISFNESNSLHDSGITSNPDGEGLQGGTIRSEPEEEGKPINQQSIGRHKLSRQDWEKFPTQPPVCSGDDGLSSRLDGITFSKWRQESIKSYGNAVVPQLIYQIFKAIEQQDT